MIERAAVAVFTEHFNATYVINFAAPFAAPSATGCAGHGFAMTADEMDTFEAPALGRRLDEACDRHGLRLAVLSRVVGAASRRVREHFARRGVPDCLHLDDWLFGVPPELGPNYAARYDAAFCTDLQQLMEGMDAVLCSTPHLAARVRQLSCGVPVLAVPGICYRPFPAQRLALRTRLGRARRRLENSGRVVVGYAGSRSHLRDLELVVPALQELMARRPEVHFETFGMPAPQALALRWPGRVRAVGFSPAYGDYMHTLYTLGWDLGLCPLVDDEFNRCKTATKLAEYTACGIPALCSDVVPYRQILGRVPDASLLAPGDWADSLGRWCGDSVTRRAGWQAADRALRDVGADRPAAAILQAWDRVAMNDTAGAGHQP